MKKTKQREIILNIINNSYEHLNAYEVYGKARSEMPNISLGTVYRNLNNLVDNKLIKKIVIDNDCDRFDRYDDHAHFICNKCSNIVDVNNFNFDKKNSIEKNIVMSYEIILRGICENCQKEDL